jgi:hypothetical protein
MVDTVRSDDFVTQPGIEPDFIRIGAEGEEYDILQGMTWCLTHFRPIVMVEMTQNHQSVPDTMCEHGYAANNAILRPVTHFDDMPVNVWFVHRAAHADRLSQLL